MRIGMTLAAWMVLGLGLVGVARADEAKKEEKPAAKGESVDFRKLKELMPTELGGLKRTECNGERNKLGEISISQCKARYAKDDKEGSPEIDVEVLDYSDGQMAKGLAAVWTMAEIDKESDDGFEKTVKVKGNPAMQTWNKEGKHGEVQILVAQRYIVTVRTENLPAEQAIKVAEALPLDKLAALK
jgi:hypothetical protein